MSTRRRFLSELAATIAGCFAAVPVAKKLMETKPVAAETKDWVRFFERPYDPLSKWDEILQMRPKRSGFGDIHQPAAELTQEVLDRVYADLIRESAA